jgi:hypothetical protein
MSFISIALAQKALYYLQKETNPLCVGVGADGALVVVARVVVGLDVGVPGTPTQT